MHRNLTIKSGLVLAAAAVLALSGCAKQEPFFPATGATKNMVDAQVAAGTRGNGNLYECHFNGDKVNALGSSKLDDMVHGRPSGEQLVVHMESEDHDLLVRRMEAVATYLKDGGLADGEIVFADQFDGSTYSPAALGLANLAKTDTSDDTSGNGVIGPVPVSDTPAVVSQ